jgi:hypothetical protein
VTAPKRAKPESWLTLITTAGLAAAITAIGSFSADRGKAEREGKAKRCDVAASFLSDETPSPYIEGTLRRRLIMDAAQAFERCMKER